MLFPHPLSAFVFDTLQALIELSLSNPSVEEGEDFCQIVSQPSFVLSIATG
jgi:hypothetical protein